MIVIILINVYKRGICWYTTNNSRIDLLVLIRYGSTSHSRYITSLNAVVLHSLSFTLDWCLYTMKRVEKTFIVALFTVKLFKEAFSLSFGRHSYDLSRPMLYKFITD